jgi:hypothetical protein
MSVTAPGTLTEGLERLRDALTALELGLAVPGANAAQRGRDELVAQIGDYLLPRLRQMDAPLLMVVGGSTGAGKSTLVNSLVGTVVSPAGVLRPTTRAPVLAANPDDVRWFEDDRILPGLPRTTGGAAAPGGLQIVATPSLPSGLSLLDSPDIDSVLAENRELAGQLLAAADAWLFVTTAARYADAVPWEYLRAARDRGTALSVVLNRVPADAEQEVSRHLRSMLDEQGLEGAELLVVPETRLEAELLPADALSPVRAWLDSLAADSQARASLVRRTLEGALASLPARVHAVETAAEEQLAAAEELRSDAEQAYAAALDEVDTALRNGSLLRGEVLARWHEVVGTGDLMRALESRVGWLRDRLRSAITGRPPAQAELEEAVESGVESVVRAAADRAAERAAQSWRGHPAGRTLLGDHPRLDVVSPDFTAAAEQEIRAWQASVFDLVREEGADKRTTARFASLGVNGAGLVVMLAVFAHTGGLTGAEVVVAGGTSALSQKVLEAIFGDQAVRALAAKARAELLERVEKLLEQEAKRFTALLEPVSPTAASLDRVREALAPLQRA